MRSTLLAIAAAWVAVSSAWALTSDEESNVAIYRRLNAGVVNRSEERRVGKECRL